MRPCYGEVVAEEHRKQRHAQDDERNQDPGRGNGGNGREGEMGIGGLKGIEHATELSARQWSCIYDHAQPRPSWPSHEEG